MTWRRIGTTSRRRSVISRQSLKQSPKVRTKLRLAAPNLSRRDKTSVRLNFSLTFVRQTSVRAVEYYLSFVTSCVSSLVVGSSAEISAAVLCGHGKPHHSGSRLCPADL